MIVLGIHQGHDSSAAIIRDGQIIAIAAEERFTRLKHCNHIPSNAILYCLEAAGLKGINEVDKVAFSWRQMGTPLKAVLGLNKPQSASKQLIKKTIKRGLATLGFGGYGMDMQKPPLYFPDLTLKDEKKLVLVEHHLAHAASAYYTRPNNDRCLIFTVDGAGDEVSTAVWVGEGSTIAPLQKLYREASIGWAYSIVTEALHWWHGDGEGKTMGLAPYGDASKCRGVLDGYFPIFKGTEIVQPTNLGLGFYWSESGAIQFHFDEAYDVEKLAHRYGRENLAAEAQRKLEECLMEYVFGWARKEKCRNTAFSGGVFLNVKLNQRIWNNRGDDIVSQHVFPDPGDSGLALGAALTAYHQEMPFTSFDLNHLYWGPQYEDGHIEALLRDRGLRWERVDDAPRRAAKMLADNLIVGWFQGRMECGPRALGNRSILMSPLRAENKDIINAKVKFREAFRPFCPSLLWEKRHDYLKDARDEFFMITSFDVTDANRDKIPAVVHVDGTVRPQMVRRETNPRYWELIDAFGSLTGEYIVLNTSFNIKGEPIINTPSEAIRCFYDGGMDALFLGNCLVTK